MPLAPLADVFKDSKSASGDVLADDCLDSECAEDSKFTSVDISLDTTTLKFERVNASDFDVLRVLGQGSFGSVFLVRKCRGRDAGTLYAMKVVRQPRLQLYCDRKLTQEHDILSAINHPFIAKLHYVIQLEGKSHLILDHVRGGNLLARLSKEVMFTEDDVKFYLAEIALALDYLHTLGIVYRNLKPGNIQLDADGHVQLTNFGMCNETADSSGVSPTDQAVNVPDYMAPEAVAQGQITTAADWWSLGVLTYEIFTGSKPFSGASRAETLAAILKAQPSVPQFISSDAQLLLRALLKRNARNRLGYGPNGFEQVKRHAFFAATDWDGLLHRRVQPPFRPAVHRVQEFCFDHTTSEYPAAVAEAEMFRGFSSIAPHLFQPTAPNKSLDTNANAATSPEYRAGTKTKCFTDEYDLCEELERSKLALWCRVVQKATGNSFVAKIIERERRDASDEIEILLRYAQHPNIIHLYDVFENEDRVYLVLETVSGGQLLDRFAKSGRFSEREAAEVTFVLAHTLQFLQTNGVVYRDLKPSNIKFADCSSRPKASSIKLCDFSLAKQLRAENGLLMTPCYTASYAAPEAIRRQGYDAACDVWSLGVVVYAMLTGSTPYASSTGSVDSPTRILDCINRGAISSRDAEVWQHVSPAGREIVTAMLHADPNVRLTVAQILKHEWIVKREQLNDVPLPIGDVNVAALKFSINATFEAFACLPVPLLESVSASLLAQRRQSRKLVDAGGQENAAR